MNTPTPEQMKEFEDFLKEVNLWKHFICESTEPIPMLIQLCTAYANHVLMKQEDSAIEVLELNADEVTIATKDFHRLQNDARKLAVLQEKVDYWVEHWNLRDEQATDLQQQLTASQERVKELEKHLDTLNAKLDDVAKKLRNIY